MTIGSLTKVLVHRWYLTIVVLAVIAWFAKGVWAQAEPEYQTSTTFLVTPSVALSTPLPDAVAGTQPGSRNPFSLAGGASTLADTVSTSLNTGAVQAGFLAQYPDAEFSAEAAISAAASRTFFTVTATTSQPDQGASVLAAALQAAAQQLLDVQHAVGAPDNGLFIIIQSTPVDGPVQQYPDRARAVGGIALGGLAAGIIVIVLIDLLICAIAGGRRKRRSSRAADPASPVDVTAAGAGREQAEGTNRSADLRSPQAMAGARSSSKDSSSQTSGAGQRR